MNSLPDVPGWIIGDRGYASDAFRERICNMGARLAIPPKRTDAPVACPSWIYNNRSRVENLWARLKEWRAMATRYEKTARSFLGILCLAAAADWIRFNRPWAPQLSWHSDGIVLARISSLRQQHASGLVMKGEGG
nr:transposase [Pseudoroseomonas wenyumeiae]